MKQMKHVLAIGTAVLLAMTSAVPLAEAHHRGISSFRVATATATMVVAVTAKTTPIMSTTISATTVATTTTTTTAIIMA